MHEEDSNWGALNRHAQSISHLTHCMTLALFSVHINSGSPTVLLMGAHKRKSLLSSTKIWYWAKPHKVEWPVSRPPPSPLPVCPSHQGRWSLAVRSVPRRSTFLSLQHNASPRLISYLSSTSNVYHWSLCHNWVSVQQTPHMLVGKFKTKSRENQPSLSPFLNDAADFFFFPSPLGSVVKMCSALPIFSLVKTAVLLFRNILCAIMNIKYFLQNVIMC